jgi:hypothetical protein
MDKREQIIGIVSDNTTHEGYKADKILALFHPENEGVCECIREYKPGGVIEIKGFVKGKAICKDCGKKIANPKPLPSPECEHEWEFTKSEPVNETYKHYVAYFCKKCGEYKTEESKPLPPQECKHEAFYHPVCVHCGKLVDDDYLIKTEKIPPQEKGIEEVHYGSPEELKLALRRLADKLNELIRAFNLAQKG